MCKNQAQDFTAIVDFRGKDFEKAKSEAREFGLRIVSCHHLLIDKCHPKKGPIFGFRHIWKDILFHEASEFYLYKVSTRNNARTLRLHFYNVKNKNLGLVDIRAHEGLDLVLKSGRYGKCAAVAYIEVDDGRFQIIETPNEAAYSICP